MKINKKLLCVLFSVLVVQGAVGAIVATDGIMQGDGEIPHEVEVKSVYERLAEIEESDEYTEKQKELLKEKLLAKIDVANERDATDGIMQGDGEIPHEVEVKSVYERLAEIEESDEYTEKQKELLKEKLLAKINAANERAADYKYTLDVPFCEQETYYYCAPATTRQTLLFYEVSNVPSQSQIASDLGVTAEIGLPDASYMIKYINSYIPDKPEYAEEHPEDEEDMILSFRTACKYYGPPIIRINTAKIYTEEIDIEEDENWAYSSKGHFLNVSGIKKSGNECTITLTDPYITWETTEYPDGTYSKSSGVVYKVIMDHWFGGYWW